MGVVGDCCSHACSREAHQHLPVDDCVLPSYFLEHVDDKKTSDPFCELIHYYDQCDHGMDHGFVVMFRGYKQTQISRSIQVIEFSAESAEDEAVESPTLSRSLHSSGNCGI